MNKDYDLFNFSSYEDYTENYTKYEKVYNDLNSNKSYLDDLFSSYQSLYNFNRLNEELLVNDNLEKIDEQKLINIPLIKVRLKYCDHEKNQNGYDSIMSLNGFLYDTFKQCYSDFKKSEYLCFKAYLLTNNNSQLCANDRMIYNLFLNEEKAVAKWSTLFDCVQKKRYTSFHKNIPYVFSLKNFKRRIIDLYLIYNDIIQKIDSENNSSLSIHKIRLQTLESFGILYELDMLGIDRNYQKKILQQQFGISPELSKKYIDTPLKYPNKFFDFDLEKVGFNKLNGLFFTKQKFLLKFMLLKKCGIDNNEFINNIPFEKKYALLASFIGCTPRNVREIEKTENHDTYFKDIINLFVDKSLEEFKKLQRDLF